MAQELSAGLFAWRSCAFLRGMSGSSTATATPAASSARAARTHCTGGIDAAAPEHPVGADPKQQEREQNRLRQIRYRERLKNQLKDIEAKVAEAQSRLLRAKFDQARLSSENGTLLTRVKTVASTLAQIADEANDAAKAAETSGVTEIDSSIQCMLGYTKCGCTRPPRPLEFYARTASVCHEHILPHMPYQHQQRQHHSSKALDRTSSSISFADVSVVRDALECHRRHTLDSMGALSAETSWYLLYTYEVRPGLRLSHSTTMGSTACHLSVVLAFWSMVLECTFLKLLEDRFLAGERQGGAHGPDIQELGDVRGSGPGVAKPPCSGAAGGGGGRPGGSAALTAPDAQLVVPAPQMQMLQRYGMMCGENHRVPIAEAVPAVLRGVMLRYRRQLSSDEWRPVCMQTMHAMCKGLGDDWPTLANVETVGGGRNSTEHTKHADRAEECPWGEVKGVAIEAVKLMVVTMHEEYKRCDASACNGAEDGLYVCDEPEMMTHACVIERARALNISAALSANMLLSDNPVAHRNMTELPRTSALDIAWVQKMQTQMYQYMNLTHAQKKTFAALWHGWQRRRAALAKEFSAALSLLSSLPSRLPATSSFIDARELGVHMEDEPSQNHARVATSDNATCMTRKHQACCGDNVLGSQLDGCSNSLRSCASDDALFDGLTSLDLTDLPALHDDVAACGVPACVTEGGAYQPSCCTTRCCGSTYGGKAKSSTAGAVQLLDRTAQNGSMHASVLQSLITPGGGEDGGGEGLLGASGVGMAAADVARSALRAVHSTDDFMLRDYSSLVLMCTWSLTEAEVRRLPAAMLEVQVPNVDMLLLFRTAAQEVAHEALFSSVQRMCL